MGGGRKSEGAARLGWCGFAHVVHPGEKGPEEKAVRMLGVWAREVWARGVQRGHVWAGDV